MRHIHGRAAYVFPPFTKEGSARRSAALPSLKSDHLCEQLHDAGDNGLLESRNRHDQYEDIADGHADTQRRRGLVSLVHVLAPDQQQDEESADRGGDGGGDVRD